MRTAFPTRRLRAGAAGAVAIGALLLGAATGAEPPNEAAAATQAAERLAPFKQALKAALQAGLAAGPSEAVDACRLRAPEIAAAHSHDGVRVGRTSHRLRNPANAGPDWVTPILTAWTAADADRTPRVVPLGDDRMGYVEPILTQALCLTCHGETLAPPIAERIRALYPEDRAVGFREGDLRGVFWIELPAR